MYSSSKEVMDVPVSARLMDIVFVFSLMNVLWKSSHHTMESGRFVDFG